MSQYPPRPPYKPPDHPQTTTILLLGICGLVLCQVLGPFAWSMGNKALREIDASGGQLGGRDTVNVGRILGMVATALLVLGVLAGIIGAVFSTALSYAVTKYILKIDWEFSLSLMISGVIVTALIVMLVGVAASFGVIFKKPLSVLRSQ